MIALLYNQSLTDEVLSNTICLVEQPLNARPLTAVSDDPRDLTALTLNNFLLGRESASAPLMPYRECYHELKIFQNGSSICRQDMEKMDAWISSTMEPTIEVVKRTCAKPERKRVSMASRWLCETMWVQIGTNHWDLLWWRRCFAISESQNGTCRELNRPLQTGHMPRTTGPEVLAPLQISYKSHQTARKKFSNWKNLAFVKTQKWSKLKIFTSWDQKFVHPPIFGRENRSNPRLLHMVRLPPSYSSTPQTLLHQTHKCG